MKILCYTIECSSTLSGQIPHLKNLFKGTSLEGSRITVCDNYPGHLYVEPPNGVMRPFKVKVEHTKGVRRRTISDKDWDWSKDYEIDENGRVYVDGSEVGYVKFYPNKPNAEGEYRKYTDQFISEVDNLVCNELNNTQDVEELIQYLKNLKK